MEYDSETKRKELLICVCDSGQGFIRDDVSQGPVPSANSHLGYIPWFDSQLPWY